MTIAQVVVIGGGVMGTSLVYHLAKLGWTDIVLLEKNDLTHGSTWHAAGLCTHFAHNPTIQELRATSVRLYRDVLPEETGESCGFHRSGAMRITSNPDRMDEFAHVAGLSDFTGYPLELLTPSRIIELHPLAKPDGLLGGIYEPDDGHVDPSLATNAMAKIARGKGVSIRRYEPVRAIEHQAGRWLISTDKEQYNAKHVVNAAGTWGWEIGNMMGLNVPSVPVLHQYLVTDAVSEVIERKRDGASELPIIRDPEQSWYVRQEGDGLILGPYEKTAQTFAVDGVPPEFGADLLPPDLDRVESIVADAMDRIPALEQAGIKSVINGPITFTPDANPLIGPAHGATNAWLLTGSSMGVMEGGGAGWFLAHWMTHGAPPMDALAIDSRRFGAWADRNYRVDKAIECFGLQFGVHYPYEERPAGRNRRLSPLHELMIERGAVMGAANGWERPNWFSNTAGDVSVESFRRSNWFDAVSREVATVTEAVGVADLSVLSKFEITGAGTQEFLRTLGANDAPKSNHLRLIHALSPAGGTMSEFCVVSWAANHAYLTSGAAAETVDLDLLRHHAASHDVEVINRTEDIAVIGLMGPKSRAVLAKLADTDVSSEAFPWLSWQALKLTGNATQVLRVSYVGELGFEIHVAKDAAVDVFLALENESLALGGGCYGAFASNSMRMEKAYRAWGVDLTTERTPIESGLAYLVNSDNREFVGRAAMIERSQSDDSWDMVLVEIEPGDFDPFYSHAVWQGNRVVGVVTSGCYGHRTGKSLALAYLRDRSARDNLSVNVLGRKRAAQILDQPPFDPTNARLKS